MASPGAWAASAGGVASATVIEPVEITRLFGLPASALELYLSQRGAAGARTGSVLIRVIGGGAEDTLAVQLPQALPPEASAPPSYGKAVLGRGLAMAVMTEEQAREDKLPVAITVAFN